MLISKEKRDLIDNCIYYDILIKCCERDRHFLLENNEKIYSLNVRFLEKVIAKAEKYLVEVSPSLHGIKIDELSQNDKFITYNFKVNGHQEQHTYYKIHMRNRVHKLLEDICNLDA